MTVANHGWLIARGWGLVAGAELVVGALLAMVVELPHRVIAAVMGFGSGLAVSIGALIDGIPESLIISLSIF